MFGHSDVLKNITALLISFSLLLIGTGLQNTLLGVRAELEGFPASLTGFAMSAFFFGHIVGAFVIPKLVANVGHIRMFSAMASLASVSAIMYAVFLHPMAWAFFRVISGFCMMGLYMVVESWINGKADNAVRGKIFSFYVAINLSSLAIGQILMTLDDPLQFELFAYSSVLLSLAVVPIALAKASTPPPITSPGINITKLWKMTPVGVVGSLIGGLIGGAYWNMSPVFAAGVGFDINQIATFMTIFILGGILFQIPVGMISDRHDRRKVLGVITAAYGVICFILANMSPNTAILFYIATFLGGGCMLCINSLATAHINDNADSADIVEVSGGILLITGIGAIIGANGASWVMDLISYSALYYFIAIPSLGLSAFTFYRLTVREARDPETLEPYQMTPTALQAYTSLDPRFDNDEHIQNI